LNARASGAPSNAHGGSIAAAILHNLAVSVEEQGKLDEAAALYERSLAARDPRAPEVRPTLVRLGRLHETAGRGEAARELYARALPLAEEELGADHRITQAIRGFLGDPR